MTTLVQTSQIFWVKLSQYCHKNFHCLLKNPRLFWMRKLARFEVVRNWVSAFYKGSDKAYEISKDNPSVLKNINVDEVVASLNKDGYCLGINLPPDVVNEIVEFAKSTPCYGNRDPEVSFYYNKQEQVTATKGEHFQVCSFLNKIEICPAIKKLERDPGLLAIAAKFLGANPVHMATDLWWSLPVPGTPLDRLKMAQVFHYDLDDYRFIKFFFYLTDVGPSSGPHVCIRGTHKNKKLLHQLLGVRCASKDDGEIVDCYGAENLVTICGPAGFGFVEDACCFHKGNPPTDKERLLLQIEYSINDYGDIRGMAS